MRCVCCADAVSAGAHARRTGPLRLVDEYMDSGAWSCGMVVGLIRDIPTCAELVHRIMSEAETIIQQRFARMLGTTGGT